MTPSYAFAVLALAFVTLGGAIPTEGLSNPTAISNISLPHIGIEFIFNRANLSIPGGPIFRVAGGRGKAIMEGPPSLAPESKGPTAMNAASSSSATLLLCEQRACGSCLAFDLLSAPHNVCLAPSVPRDFRFSSVAISQPSNRGLPFAVGVSPPVCGAMACIPYVNTCFDVANGAYADFALLG